MMLKLRKNTLLIDQFKLKCSVGKGGIRKKIKEGDKITPKGIFNLGPLYYRSDKIKFVKSKLILKKIKKNMGWCDDPNSKLYNRPIKIPKNYKYSHEKLYRKDSKYDFVIPIKYNFSKPIKNKGSAIFLHISKKNYSSTEGCIAISKSHIKKLLMLISSSTKVKIV